MTQADIEKFLYREVRLLDERRFEEWTDLFAEDGYYWVPAYPGQDDPYKAVSIFFDDRDLMRTRLSRQRIARYWRSADSRPRQARST